MTHIEAADAVDRAAHRAETEHDETLEFVPYEDMRILRALAKALRAGRERDMVSLDHYDDQPRRVLVIELPEQQKEG